MRLLCTTLPSNDLGLLARALPLAAELRRQGVEIAFCSPAPVPSRLVAQAGFENLLPPHPLYHLLAVSLPGWVGLRQMAASPAFGRAFGGWGCFLRACLRGLPRRFPPITSEIWDMDHISAFTGMLDLRLVRSAAKALAQLLQEGRFDGLLDFWNPLACLAARLLRLPLVTVIQADMHPASRGFIWWRDPPPDLPSCLPAINQFLTENGLPRLRKTAELCLGAPTLVVGMPDTDPLPAGTDVAYTGALLWEAPGAALPAWLDDLPRDQPLVWAYTGNPQYLPGLRSPVDSLVILEAAVAALAGEPLQVVLTTGGHLLPPRLPPLPANFHFAPYLPGPALARRCDLLLHHGGYGSCQTGLAAGKPAVIIPTFSERESNARRLSQAGAALMLQPSPGRFGCKLIDPGDLRTAVWRALREHGYTQKARELGEKLRAYGGAEGAARAVLDAFEHTLTTSPHLTP